MLQSRSYSVYLIRCSVLITQVHFSHLALVIRAHPSQVLRAHPTRHSVLIPPGTPCSSHQVLRAHPTRHSVLIHQNTLGSLCTCTLCSLAPYFEFILFCVPANAPESELIPLLYSPHSPSVKCATLRDLSPQQHLCHPRWLTARLVQCPFTLALCPIVRVTSVLMTRH